MINFFVKMIELGKIKVDDVHTLWRTEVEVLIEPTENNQQLQY